MKLEQMKVILGLVLGAALVAGAAGAAFTASNLNLVLSSQNPYPVEPGEVVNVEVELQNSGLSDATNIILEIEPKAPFSLMEGEKRVVKSSLISGSGSVKKTFKLKVNKTAESGEYDLDFRYYGEGETAITVRKSVTIRVQGKPHLVIRKITTDPETIEPGKDFELAVLIENVGTGKLYYMEGNLNSSSSYILPVLSGGSYYIGEMGPGEVSEATFRMSVDTGAGYTTYPCSLVLSYTDETNTKGSETFSLGLPVRGMPVIEVLSAEIDDSRYKVDIENIGTAIAKALKITLVQNGEVRDVSVTNELKPSKHKTLRFSGFDYGNAVINMTFLDESNSPYVVETPVSITQSGRSSSGEDGGSGAYSGIIPFLVIIVVLETYYIWRIRKRKNRP